MQSIDAAINSMIAGIYLGFVFIAVYVFVFIPSAGLPLFFMLWAFKNDSKLSPIVAVILTPLGFAASYALFFSLLPYAAWTIHWLPVGDVIRSANGPATVFYKLAVEPDIPRIGPKHEIQLGDTANRRLRAHILATFVSPFKRTKRHLRDSLQYEDQAYKIISKQPDLIVIIPKEDVETIIAAYQAALREAQQVDADLLNEYVDGLGITYQEKFIPGLQHSINFWEDGSMAVDQRGQLFLKQWNNWYNEHLDLIRDAL